jgi:hypothetical protein
VNRGTRGLLSTLDLVISEITLPLTLSEPRCLSEAWAPTSTYDTVPGMITRVLITIITPVPMGGRSCNDTTVLGEVLTAVEDKCS